MGRIWIGTLAGMMLLALAPLALAQPPAATMPGVDQRQETQQQRIQQGIESGALTEKEAARLQKQQTRIEAHQQKAQADGQVTKQERAKLHREQDRASRSIAKQKHDRQRAKK